MSTELDKRSGYGEVRGKLRAEKGAWYLQNGKYFGVHGKEIDIETGEQIGMVEVKTVEENLVEFDMDSITDLEGFDLFRTALKEADNKPAKQALKAFALEIVGMEKINLNKGLDKLIDEVHAEYKAVLELDIE